MAVVLSAILTRVVARVLEELVYGVGCHGEVRSTLRCRGRGVNPLRLGPFRSLDSSGSLSI